MPDWLLPLISIVVGLASGALGGFMGVRISVARLEAQMEDARSEIRTLRDRSHDQTSALLQLDGRVKALERVR